MSVRGIPNRARGFGPAGKPGTGKRKNNPDYQANLEARKNQQHPAKPTPTKVKGPTHHPSPFPASSGNGYAHQKFIESYGNATRASLS